MRSRLIKFTAHGMKLLYKSLSYFDDENVDGLLRQQTLHMRIQVLKATL